MTSLHDIYLRKIMAEKQISEFYATIVRNIYKEIEKAIHVKDKAIFFNLPVLRFGEAVENVNDLGKKIKDILATDGIRAILVKRNSPLMYIFWEEQGEELEYQYEKWGASNLDDFIEKHRR